MFVGAMSDYLEKKLLDHTFNNKPYTSPEKVYLALYTSNPGEEDRGDEITEDSYNRVEIDFSEPSETLVSNPNDEDVWKCVVSNIADLNFPVAEEAWGEVTHAVVRDAKVGGNPLFYGPLKFPKVVEVGDRLVFLKNDLKLGMD